MKELATLAKMMETANRLTISPGSLNAGKSSRLEGAYVTVTVGLSTSTWFIGTKDGHPLVENVS